MNVRRRPKKIGRWMLLAIILLAIAVGAYRGRTGRCRGVACVSRPSGPAADDSPIGRVVPDTTRITVEVLNATDTRGVARQAMFALRDAGFDVVFHGNTLERRDSTEILDRSGHTGWAMLAAKAMRGGRILQQPDSSRFLDLTVLVGRNWTPPRLPLHP